MTSNLDKEWFAKPDDLIGGWCVMSRDVNPSEDHLAQVADMADEATANHIANLHNTWLFYKKHRPRKFHVLV